jgi:hypothetical protein
MLAGCWTNVSASAPANRSLPVAVRSNAYVDVKKTRGLSAT